MSVARYRPAAAIIAATPLEQTARKLTLAWGVQTVVLPFSEQTGALMDEVALTLAEKGLVERGQLVAITAGLATRTPGGTDFIHVRAV
jgi:pyruvate kinase